MKRKRYCNACGGTGWRMVVRMVKVWIDHPTQRYEFAERCGCGEKR